jgi:hypothetical protein
MTILPVLDAAVRSQHQLDAMARLTADAERTEDAELAVPVPYQDRLR